MVSVFDAVPAMHCCSGCVDPLGEDILALVARAAASGTQATGPPDPHPATTTHIHTTLSRTNDRSTDGATALPHTVNTNMSSFGAA